MRIEWTIPALEALDEILEFISARSMIAATRIERRIATATAALATFPESGRPAPNDPGMRELVVTPYLVQFKVDRDRIIIASIRHGARDQEAPDSEQVHEPEVLYRAEPASAS